VDILETDKLQIVVIIGLSVPVICSVLDLLTVNVFLLFLQYLVIEELHKDRVDSLKGLIGGHKKGEDGLNVPKG
jgi:hypothetical protein